jgi:putative membrane protein
MTTDAVKSVYRWLQLFFCGLCMGAADIVPGISGGTIAFIMGFYEELLSSIKSFDAKAFVDLFCLRFSSFQKRINWRFLLPLGIGIVTAFIALAQLIQYLLGHETHRVLLYSLFLGLIISSIGFCAKEIKRWHISHGISLCVGTAIAFLLTGTSLTTSFEEPLYDVAIDKSWQGDRDSNNFSKEHHKLLDVPQSTLIAMIAREVIDKETIVYSHQEKKEGPVKEFVAHTTRPWIDGWIICCGAIAISAMLLPGISGSYLLTILGVYGIAIGAIADLSHGLQHGAFDSDAFLFLCNMAFGIVLGGLLFARVVAFLLDRYQQITIALMTGFMIGALRSVWPFWSYRYLLNPLHLERGPELVLKEPLIPHLDTPLFWMALAAIGIGMATVIAVSKLRPAHQ